MATAHVRLRMLWGAFDMEAAESDTPGYVGGQIVSGGDSAGIGDGVGVRRSTLVIDRSARNSLLDPAIVHFDWLNTTGGAPDDTWTTTDFTQMETSLKTWMAAVVFAFPATVKFTTIIWHRVGSGLPKPNPAERTTLLAPAIGGGAVIADGPDQVAASITFKTGVRRSWGRTYLPFYFPIGVDGTIPSNRCDDLAVATEALAVDAASNDFHHVVVSAPLSSSLNVEHIQVDNVPDVIRRRRLKHKTYAKVLPA